MPKRLHTPVFYAPDILDLDDGQMRARDRRRLRMYGERTDHWRPETRADCATVPRPCPYVGCRYNLYLDVTREGLIRYNFPDLEPGEMEDSCALDAAEDGYHNQHEVADFMNVARQRVQQIELEAMDKIKRLPQTRNWVRDFGLREYANEKLQNENSKLDQEKSNRRGACSVRPGVDRPRSMGSKTRTSTREE